MKRLASWALVAATLLGSGAAAQEGRPAPWALKFTHGSLDTYSLTYPRGFVAKADGQLTFTASGTAFQVSGLPTANVVVYRVDGDGSVSRLANVAVTGSAGNQNVVKLKFHLLIIGHRFF